MARVVAAPCTVIHAISHQAQGETFIPRQNMISEDKNAAEGAPEETKICLGWLLNTRLLLVNLPIHKYKAWDSQLVKFIASKSTNGDDIESILGRLEHVAIIMSMLGHELRTMYIIQEE